MLCWFFRLMVSSASDSDTHIGRTTSRHVARCAGCRQFYESCRLLNEGLRSQADGWQHASPQSASVEFEIRNAVETQDLASPPGDGTFHIPRSPFRMWRVPHSPRSPIRAALAIAACIAIATTTTILFRVQSPNPPAPQPLTTGAAVPLGIDSPTAWVHLIERPLTTEVRSLTRDTESGIRFLVACLNVGLPSNVPPTSDQPLPPQ